MQYDYLINNIERLKEVKEQYETNNLKFTNGDDLFIQHLNAELEKFINTLKVKMHNKIED